MPVGGTPTVTPVGDFTVKQGPKWLADLFYAPPEWFMIVLVALFLGASAVLGYAFGRGYVDEGFLVEAWGNIIIALAALVATFYSVNYLELGYALDVLLGLVAAVLMWVLVEWKLEGPQTDETGR